MAREPSASASTRRQSGGLEAHRSSVRRVPGSRPSGAARPAPVPRSAPPGKPRNRRVARAPARPSGPPLGVRLLALACALAVRAQRLTGVVAAVLSRRLPAGPTLAVRVVALLLALGGVVLIGRFMQRHLTTAPAFAIDTIDVSGLKRVDRAELLRTAGIQIGTNVFTRSAEEIRARLLQHPWIVQAEVNRTLPSRFALAITEREPVAIMVVESCGPAARGMDDDPLCDEPSSLYLVSAEATLFKRVGGKDPVDLPVITGITRKRYSEDPEGQRRILGDALGLLAAYREADLWERSAIGEIHLEPNDGFSLYVGEDLTYVRLGLPPFEAKFRRMKRVFERLEREHARAAYVYLDNAQRPDRVTVGMR